ncbi:MAG: undecaprenyl/decaprenyl-phosphate alpha-N-acetylglucosaminyl 1-phosphate transferase [Propionibacteriaceae bacterium]|jgi:UDP-GlcNAc:undecaprenyl-phosphate GlcNAc-1-phosphate transferase|nr:undecaprenyl/decaprenyl-phosphate alpha-N-acetylglucosaminyl 1-phosphate transferase [Propionibacteriaceae bacterium]
MTWLESPMREYVLVALIGLVVCFCLTPACRSLAIRLGATAPVRDRDVHQHRIPYFGGLAMLGGLAAAYLIASRMPFLSRYPSVTADSLVILAAGCVICLVGVIDDLYDLNAAMKIAGQVLAAGVLVLGGVRVHWVPWNGGILTLDPVAGIVITVVVVFVCANAINIVDGLDGLAAGIVAISASAFFIYAYWLTTEEDIARATTAALVTVVMCGVCIGYLPHNFHPATIFMGDSGAMLLGLLFAASTISLTGQIDPTNLADRSGLWAAYVPMILPLISLGLPFLDMIVAYTRRTWHGVWWFVADKQHLHHRLLQRGHSQLGAVMIMYVWTALLSYSAMIWGLFPSFWSGVTVLAVVVAALAFVVLTGRRVLPIGAEVGQKATAKGKLKPCKVNSGG